VLVAKKVKADGMTNLGVILEEKCQSLESPVR
jgi:hypothetical protein